MRKWMVFVSLLLVALFSGCGGGGSSGASGQTQQGTDTSGSNGNSDSDLTNPGNDNPETGTPGTDPIVEQPRIKTQSFTAIPQSQMEETVVFVTNDSFANAHPNWTMHAQVAVDQFNLVLAKTTTKHITAIFKTCPDNAFANAATDPTFHHDNNFSSGAGGTTIFDFVYTDASQIPEIVKIGDLRTANASAIVLNGKRYEHVFISESASLSILLGKAVVDLNSRSVGHYEQALFPLFHEWGHTLSLAADEGYNYVFTDQSGDLPNLGSYSRRTTFPNDPMSMEAWFTFDLPAPVITYQFSPFNSWLIQKNANHQYNLWEITQGIPSQVWIKVTRGGAAVAGAEVKLYAAAKNAIVFDNSNAVNLRTVLGTFTTDAQGYVKLQTSRIWDMWENNEYIAWGIKAAQAGAHAGTLLTVTDLESAFLKDGINTLELSLQLQ